MADETEIDIDPLFIAMTRPPLIMGTPIEFFGLNFILLGVGLILFMSLTGKVIFFILINLPLHGIAYLATERDPHWIKIWMVKIDKCAVTQNYKYWKANSLKP